MTPYEVFFAPEAGDQLEELFLYIAGQTSATTARRYTSGIVAYCESTFPKRGAMRDDIRPGLRTTHYKGRTVIAFAVDDAAMQVSILGVFYGGRDYAAALAAPPGN